MKTAVFAAAAAALALSLSAPAIAQDAGEPAFKNACAKCHTVEKALALMKRQPDAAKRGPWIDKHLKGHFAPDAALRAAIIGFLEKRLTGAK